MSLSFSSPLKSLCLLDHALTQSNKDFLLQLLCVTLTILSNLYFISFYILKLILFLSFIEFNDTLCWELKKDHSALLYIIYFTFLTFGKSLLIFGKVNVTTFRSLFFVLYLIDWNQVRDRARIHSPSKRGQMASGLACWRVSRPTGTYITLPMFLLYSWTKMAFVKVDYAVHCNP